MKKTLVENINNGIIINQIFNYWLEIKNFMQYDIFKDMIKYNKFGTYNNLSIIDILDKFKDGTCSNWEKNTFIKECKEILINN
jgi:hypothetical protein